MVKHMLQNYFPRKNNLAVIYLFINKACVHVCIQSLTENLGLIPPAKCVLSIQWTW